MTDLKTEVRHILVRHEGHDRPITGKELADILKHNNDRKIRLAIRQLISEGLPVASSVHEPMGYFIVTTWEEARLYAESIRNRLIEDALRRRDFRRSAAMYLKPAQQKS